MYSESSSVSPTQVGLALASAVRRVPPLYPLKQWVAVNPFLGYSREFVTEAAETLAKTGGLRLFSEPAFLLDAWRSGEIGPEDLQAAQDLLGTHRTEADLLALLRSAPNACSSLPTVAKFLDERDQAAHWAALFVEGVSSFLATYCDEGQTTWSHPWKEEPLFAAWRSQMEFDRTLELQGLKGYRELLQSLPSEPTQVVESLCRRLKPKAVDTESFLLSQLVPVWGWAGYLQYREREKELRQKPGDDSVAALVAICLSLEVALFEQELAGTDAGESWFAQNPPPPSAEVLAGLNLWQTAYELHQQRILLGQLNVSSPSAPTVATEVQAVFCIDVRSERMRRQLEAVAPEVRTLGFAGFFGVAVENIDAVSEEKSSRGPALFAPALVSQTSAGEVLTAKRDRAWERAWAAFQNASVSCFTYVESFGLAAVQGLLGGRSTQKVTCAKAKPTLKGLETEKKVDLAAGLLRAMQLTKDFAPLVLFCGHGSSVANNPQAAGLQCGACGGHAGDHNARLAAGLLNDPDVRLGLAAKGIDIPSSTLFLAGLHETVSDQVELQLDAEVPPAQVERMARLRQALANATARVAREKSPQLKGERSGQERSLDIAETRPEWGLAGNYALIFAPRALSRSADLQGRVFLHDYDENLDSDGAHLAFLLSAPGVVASWINLQYYGSRLNPERLGAGNKTLHNVCAGVGVLEGRTGDLQTGLALQSLHDGNHFVHEPRRLTWVVQAARSKVDQALASAPSASELVNGGWVHLVVLDRGIAYRRNFAGAWVPAA